MSVVTGPRPATRDDRGRPTRWAHRGWLVAGAAVVTFTLLRALRVWLPSIVHVYGDAGSTPAAQLGLFALAWFLLPLLGATRARRVDTRLLWRGGVVVAAVGRFALQLTDGGQPQLYVAGVTVVGASLALVALAAGGPSGHLARVGVVIGLGVDTVLHAALGTVHLQWRSGILATVLVAAVAVASIAVAERARQVPLWWPSPVDDDGEVAAVWTRGAAWPWLAVGPAIALTGILVAAPARLQLAADLGPRAATTLLSLAVGVAILAAAIGPRLGPPVAGTAGAVLVVLCTFGAVRPIGAGAAAAQLGLAVALGLVLGAPGTTPGDSGPRRRGTAAAGSLLLLFLVVLAAYGVHDLPLPFDHQAPLLAAAAGLAVLAIAVARDGRAVQRVRKVPLRGLLTAAVGVVAVGLVGALATPVPTPGRTLADGDAVRLAAYNVHGGYDLRGRLDLPALVEAIRDTGADIVVLNEVDRGWLLGGGHDLLRLLHEATGMEATFAPAADDVWGNAVLSRVPLRDVRTVPLPGGGAAMRRSYVSAVADVPGGELAIVGTHLHHVTADGSIRAAQARALAAEVARLTSRGLPVAVLGDLNAPFDSPDLLPLADLLDAVPGGEPTFPADAPQVRLDHILVTPGVTAIAPAIGTSTASDHLPVAVTVTLPDGAA